MRIKNFHSGEQSRENVENLFFYEYSNHLGNVLEVVTDRKLQVQLPDSEPGDEPLDGGIVDYYIADVVSQSDYYPFGMLMPNTNIEPEQVLIGGVWKDVAVISDNDYRYGFNGMEDDEEMTNANGQSYDFGARLYNPRVGRWFSRDAHETNYTGICPYVFVGENPIMAREIDGNDFIIAYTIEDPNPTENGSKWKTVYYTYGSSEPVPDNNFVRETIQTLDYLHMKNVGDYDLGDGKSVNVLEIFGGEAKDITISNSGYETYYEEGTGWDRENAGAAIIRFDPNGGARFRNPGESKIERRSPALSLLHELGHAYNAQFRREHFWKGKLSEDPIYTNLEEKDVITNLENVAAPKLGETKRFTHKLVDWYTTSGPTTTQTPKEVKEKKENDALNDLEKMGDLPLIMGSEGRNN